MSTKVLTKEQLNEQISDLQDRINSLEKEILIQRHIEDELKVSEKNLSAILEKNADGIVVVDIKGTVLYVNPAAEKLFNRSKEDFLAYPFGFPVSTDKKDDTLLIIKEGMHYEVEFRVVRIQWQGQPALQLSIRDITERILAQKALKESEEKCKIIFDRANDGMFLVDLETRKFFMCNASCARMLGYEQEEFPELEIADIHPAEDLPFIYEQIGKFSKGLTGIRNDIRFKCKNGNLLTTDLSPTLLPISGKNYLLMIFRDITKRIQMEEALRESEEKFKSITENSADAIFIADMNGKYVYTNKAVTHLLGFSPEEMKGKTIIDLAPENRIDEHLDIFKNLQAKGKIFTEIELLQKDGNFVSTDLNSVILPGNLVYGSCRDITDRKQGEVALIAAKEKAEESDRLKSAFLHNISHEIRTPMNAIVGFSGFLSNPDLTPEKRKQFTDIIIQSSNQLLSIITDIMSIASIEAGHEKIQENEININLICKLINEQFSPKAPDKKVTLSLKTILADDEAIIITDATKLTQILTNLIGNALKFTQEGYVNFGYTVKDSQLEFYVEDSGIGISLDMQDAIFDRFRQVETTATRDYGGSGLGLSISKAYIEMLGGKIWLTSELNKGSVFCFTIPYKKVNPKKLPDIPSIKELRFEYKKPKTLLIAEDEDSNFMLLEELLSDMGINIIRAVNGIEAVELCKSNPLIDLVLMDIKMPEMDGYEATIQIREFNPDLYIIAQTAYTTEIDKNKAFACGCSDFMSKPLKRELLISKINEQLLK